MMPPTLYVRREEPTSAKRFMNALWKIVLCLFLAIAIESFFVTLPIGYHIFMASRKPHVHTNSHSH